MGSVSDTYRCPWCGRRGNGGYAADWIGYPICCGKEVDDYSCLHTHLLGDGPQTKLEYDVVAFRRVARGAEGALARVLLSDGLLPKVLEFRLDAFLRGG